MSFRIAQKLVWNVPFNGLSILAGGIDPAAILQDEDLRRTTLGPMNAKRGEKSAAKNTSHSS
jgi:hypothetical protein